MIKYLIQITARAHWVDAPVRVFLLVTWFRSEHTNLMCTLTTDSEFPIIISSWWESEQSDTHIQSHCSCCRVPYWLLIFCVVHWDTKAKRGNSNMNVKTWLICIQTENLNRLVYRMMNDYIMQCVFIAAWLWKCYISNIIFFSLRCQYSWFKVTFAALFSQIIAL